MTQSKTRVAETSSVQESSVGLAESSESSSLLDQARAYGKLAQEAREECEQKEVDEEKELLNRRNQSGQ